MELDIKGIPHSATSYDITKFLASTLHSEEFLDRDDPSSRPMNFKVILVSSGHGIQNTGNGQLLLRSRPEGEKFLRLVREHPLHISGRKLWFGKSGKKLTAAMKEQLRKAPYIDPDIDEERRRLEEKLNENFRVASVQFGVYYRQSVTANRSFSIEYDRDTRSNDRAAWLRMHYVHKVLRIQLGNKMTEEIGRTIVVRINTVKRLGYGFDFGNPFICFELNTPPLLEEEQFYRTLTGDERKDNRDFRHRLVALDEAHRVVAPYAYQLRVVLASDARLQDFVSLAKDAGLPVPVRVNLEASTHMFYCREQLRKVELKLRCLPWKVAFQVEALLRILRPEELLAPGLWKQIESQSMHDVDATADFLRSFVEDVSKRPPSETSAVCFERICQQPRTPLELKPGMFAVGHITFCPSRVLLEGPFATQSNRVIREYEGYEENFVRVDFREEDRMQYRWDQEVDGLSFLQERVGGILKNGFELAGRHFEFLAYSSSALKQHAVWFLHPFQHQTRGLVDANYIRARLGKFSGAIDDLDDAEDKKKKLRYQPAKFAARMAQAFTATDPSVKLTKDQWKEIPDMGTEPQLHTDGCGTISPQLAEMIWDVLSKARKQDPKGRLAPSCYQIRFLGYKGVVTVDERLEGIMMCLRPSMNKFEAHETESAEIEIAQAFWKPGSVNMNRALIMILEDRGVPMKNFMRLQDEVVAKIQTATESVDKYCECLNSGNKLGSVYRVVNVMRGLSNLGFDFKPRPRVKGLPNPFLLRLVEFTKHHLLRDIKHAANIPLKEAYLLPGVADEGPAYEAEVDNAEDVFSLEEMKIYVCVQAPEDEKPTWIKGNCVIWRSPVVHPGDIQRVYAIGEPPPDKICYFRNLKNVVVLPSKGPRSLASCLGGGDVDGDLFCVSPIDLLLPTTFEDPAEYSPVDTKTLDRPAEIEDICDFIVEYISSDVLGLLADKHLVIADQSQEGSSDPQCLRLAELCSQAVDYAKNGIPIKLENERKTLKQLIPFKPDWHAAEVVSPRKTDYYQSTRALGHLYRAIKLQEPDTLRDMAYPDADVPGVNDAISQALQKALRRHERKGFKLDNSNNMPEWLHKLYARYVSEMHYISGTHALTPDNTLTEEEIVLSTILAKCSQRRLRKDRMQRMRDHSGALVDTVRDELWVHAQQHEEPPEAATQRVCRTLERAWRAWRHAVADQGKFGANSFGLIALGIIFDCKEKIENVP